MVKINAGYIIMQYTKKIAGKKNLSEEDKIVILSEIISPLKYIEYKEKQEICRNIILDNVKFDGRLIYDSSKIYYEFVLLLLNKYFNLDKDSHTYNSLSSNGILGFMLVLISDEYQMMKGILDSYMGDLKNGNLSLEDIKNYGEETTIN